jgi:hypothetical protein
VHRILPHIDEMVELARSVLTDLLPHEVLQLATCHSVAGHVDEYLNSPEGAVRHFRAAALLFDGLVAPGAATASSAPNRWQLPDSVAEENDAAVALLAAPMDAATLSDTCKVRIAMLLTLTGELKHAITIGTEAIDGLLRPRTLAGGGEDGRERSGEEVVEGDGEGRGSLNSTGYDAESEDKVYIDARRCHRRAVLECLVCELHIESLDHISAKARLPMLASAIKTWQAACTAATGAAGGSEGFDTAMGCGLVAQHLELQARVLVAEQDHVSAVEHFTQAVRVWKELEDSGSILLVAARDAKWSYGDDRRELVRCFFSGQQFTLEDVH